jgi:hypothetical protein
MALQVAETTRGDGAGGPDEAQIRKLVTDRIEISNEHDARAYARHCADDADLTTVLGVTGQGREAIDAHNAQVFENLFKKRPLPPDWVRSGNRVAWKMMGALDWDEQC